MSEMISRRQIISGQPGADRQQSGGPSAASSLSSAASKPSGNRMTNQRAASQRQQQQQPAEQAGAGQAANRLGASRASKTTKSASSQLTSKQMSAKTTATNSDDYLMSSSSNHQYEDYVVDDRIWRQQPQLPTSSSFNHDSNQDNATMNEPFRQHFDPYSIYSDEEDVWCSEERLFEDHLEEIYNKWPLLDDDIWCKLIIMERNRRIGKAYARVPIVTIDGSHELSYDGYKLALNGFDNPDRDEETEECRKRIGKGVKIKMDNFGNILIKRMSKAGVYVKEWINPAPVVSGGSSNSTNGSSGAGVGRSMPSRQQLIKAASMAGGGAGHMPSLMTSNGTGPSNSSSSNSSMDSPNDSAICDEVITIGGRLEHDKIYVLFDIKKFQANISQELCRAYPDRRKLEQQCFSIVGLARDSEDILNLPCWLMVINIVAVEMLNERVPATSASLDDDVRHGLCAGFADARRLRRAQAPPSFVSIFENQSVAGGGGGDSTKQRRNNQRLAANEEDPYSLPANASSSDMRSSINDYGSASTKNLSNYMEMAGATDHHHHHQLQQRTRMPAHSSRFYGTPKNLYQSPAMGGSRSELMQRQRSKSNHHIYGPAGARYNANGPNGERYNNNSSIYSPGHMLVPHAPGADRSVPPKLPPRDFVAKKGGQRSKSSSNLVESMKSKYEGGQAENIYSTGVIQQAGEQNDDDKTTCLDAAKPTTQRRTKRNRFLDSLKAPLELAKSGRSSSVLGVPGAALSTSQTPADAVADSKNKPIKSKRNLRSFLRVGKSKSSASEESNYVHVDERGPSKTTKNGEPTKLKRHDSGQADSVVDSNEELDESHHQAITNSSGSPDASYNDLDIPTPDYETDENIYALDDGNHYQQGGRRVGPAATGKQQGGKSGANARSRRYSTSSNHINNNNDNDGAELGPPKDDLYYSGFRAHVPHHHHHGGGGGAGHYAHTSSTMARANERLVAAPGRVEPNATANSRYLIRTSRMLAAKMGARDPIYGSTLGLQHQQQQAAPMAGARYRSASMQRYYSTTGNFHPSRSNQRLANGAPLYDADIENPYAAMSAGLGSMVAPGGPLDDAVHYGVTSASSCIGGAGAASRRRSVSKLVAPASGRSLVAASSSQQQQHDVGRSSSGIYGINSGSSSSEYADWQPQVRKVNSSGYLNSIFKGHQLNKLAAVGTQQDSSAPLESASGMISNNNNNIQKETSKGSSSQVRNYVARSLKSTQQVMNQEGGAGAGSKKLPGSSAAAAASSVINGPDYRAYDSSNDSDPSYTNSSDGLDIYDQIGAHHPRLGHQHQQPAQQHLGQLRGHNQFLEHNLAPVHVGEWENMYDR